LILRPDIEDRSFHETTKAYTGPENTFPEAISKIPKGFRFQPAQDRCLMMDVDKGEFHIDPQWQYMVYRPLEAQRSLDAHSDLFSPGYFACTLLGNSSITIKAFAGSFEKTIPDLPAKIFTEKIQKPYLQKQRFLDMETALRLALNHYVVQRKKLKTVIAGYPWFLDWGRDTLIVVRGLIAANRKDTSRAILQQFASFEEHGTLPNMIRGNDAGNRDTSDAPLWFFTAVADLVQMEGKLSFLDSACGNRKLSQVLTDLAQSIITGTPNGVKMDHDSGLIYSPAHFTWMDTNYPAGTPRAGYPIEIQALWFAALTFLNRIDAPIHHISWKNLAQKVQNSIRKLFFNPKEGFLSDCLHALPDVPAKQAVADNALRPNQLFALTLGAISDPNIYQSVLEACKSLLVPGAIRTLADRLVSPPLAIYRDGQLLNDPDRPYQGKYIGDEDTSRKPAYHNGTAWTWVFPSFCEAWVQYYGTSAVETALAWLSSSTELMNTGCAGQLPEIVDGDYPHTQRGCDAQAWGVSELLRVWIKLNNIKKG
jgi:predicted glycogen debranching enzyme